jgi:DNA-directed RNA polymerase subunit M/transcription elongation factor TFIIS
MSYIDTRPATLQAMITYAIRIDNRLYERTIEKKGHYSLRYSHKGKQKQRHPDAIEIDAIKQGLRLSKEELDRHRQKKLCFKCRKEGHRASSYC